MLFWKTPWKPSHEEKLSLILPDCEHLKNTLLKWNKRNFLIAYCLETFVIYIFVEDDMGFEIEGWRFFFVQTLNNCGPIDVLTFEPLIGKIVFYDSKTLEDTS
jgi:hypothetical protein